MGFTREREFRNALQSEWIKPRRSISISMSTPRLRPARETPPRAPGGVVERAARGSGIRSRALDRHSVMQGSTARLC